MGAASSGKRRLLKLELGNQWDGLPYSLYLQPKVAIVSLFQENILNIDTVKEQTIGFLVNGAPIPETKAIM